MSRKLLRNEKSPRKGKIRKFLSMILLIVIVAIFSLYLTFRASLPTVDGLYMTSSIEQNILVERDENGNATLSAENRGDLAYATGFIHAQERFFQIDLSRRMAAGELSELFGLLALDTDKKNRLHRFRKRAKVALSHMTENNKKLIKKYVSGVNDGLNELGSKPFEYWLLQEEPRAWMEEDSILVIYSMFIALQNGTIEAEKHRYFLENSLDSQLAAFLLPLKTEWDAPLQADDTPWVPQEIPEQSVLKSHKMDIAFLEPIDNLVHGSNNWAVSGNISKTGAAILSNDMHLGIRAPSTWYRLRLKLNDKSLDISGVSLPGAPLIIAGSNGHVAWGYTNSFVDVADFIELKLNPDDEQQYLTPEGYQNFIVHNEEIVVKGEDPTFLAIKETIWGPVFDLGATKKVALRWVAHDPEAVSMGLINMEQVKTVKEAMAISAGNKIPAQNAMLVDKEGNLGWVHFGALPKRKMGAGDNITAYSRPADWSDGTMGWDGWLTSAEHPRVYNPPRNRLWTANSRVVSGGDFNKVGDGSADIGARQKQIRDRLMLLDQDVVEQDLYAIQLDDRAIFWDRWQKQLLNVLKKTDDNDLSSFTKDVENWGGRAAIESVGFRLVKNYRKAVFERMMGHLTAPCVEKFPSCNYKTATHQMDSPLWRLVDQRPDGWLPSEFEGNWQNFFEDMARHAWVPVLKGDIALKDYIWGEQNRSYIQHPLSRSVPLLGLLTDMPNVMQNGVHKNMPHIAGGSFGQSERIVVSPGHEEDGIMNMPSGQSGHPLSPYYGAGHNDWLKGKITPFLPGKTKWTFQIIPAS